VIVPRSRRMMSLLGAALLGLGVGLAVTGPAAAAAATVSAAPLPPVYAASTVYTLAVNGVAVPVDGYTGYDYAGFSMTAGTATITVTKLNGTDVGAAYISPVKQGYAATLSHNTATFTIPAAQYLIVKLDGQRRLVIAADPAETNRPPASGAGIFNVTSSAYGADPTGARLSTAAIQKALDAASAYGTTNATRGTVYIPRGVYPVGNLTLKSHTAVYLEDGAVLRVTADRSQYSMDAFKSSMNLWLTWFIRTAPSSTDIEMYGRGTLDGNGAAAKNANFGTNVLVPLQTSNFTLDGLTIREAASWAVIPVRSDNLTFTNMKVYDRLDMGEDDAVDVIESQHVRVARGIGIALDDSYSTKSYPAGVGGITANWPGSPEPVTDVVFDGLLSWTDCYSYKVGQGVGTAQSGITFQNSVVYDAAVALGIDHKAYTAAASGVTFSNIDVEHLDQGPNAGNQSWLVIMVENQSGDGGGPISNVRFSHIKVRDSGSTAGRIDGLSAASPVSGVTLDSIRMPGSTGYATSLAQMNITDVSYATGITIQG
jgi:hypothetical protein